MHSEVRRELLTHEAVGLIVVGHQMIALPVHQQRRHRVAGEADVDAAPTEIPGQYRMGGEKHRVAAKLVEDGQHTRALYGSFLLLIAAYGVRGDVNC